MLYFLIYVPPYEMQTKPLDITLIFDTVRIVLTDGLKSLGIWLTLHLRIHHPDTEPTIYRLGVTRELVGLQNEADERFW